MNIASRNDYCPCGSGKRYKDCHGRIDARRPQSVQELMGDALVAQQGGRMRNAANLYGLVLAEDPANFDATHMLGVIQYQRGRFDDALVLLRRATQLRPDVATARHNLSLVEAISMNELELCRDALARAATLVEPISDIAGLLHEARLSHLIVAEDFAEQDGIILQRLVAEGPSDGVHVWATSDAQFRSSDVTVLDAMEQSHPVGGLMIFFGVRHSSLAWLGAAQPKRVVLVVTRDDPSALLDGIRKLSLEGRRRIGLAYATSALAARIRFPRGALHVGQDRVRTAATIP
jgi:tetratricopeptide (TPR) repeat protein